MIIIPAFPAWFKRKYLVWRIASVLLVIFLVVILYTDCGPFLYAPPVTFSSHSALILDTPGCKIPRFDPYDKSIRSLISAMKPYVCRGDRSFMITRPNATILLDEQVLETVYRVSADQVTCTYKPIYRGETASLKSRENLVTFGDTKQLHFGVPLDEEFIKVECQLGRRRFTQFLPLVPIKPEVEKRASESKPKGEEDSLNVILVGIDSVSKLNFLRHFKKTRSFLVDKMSAFEMKGYTKVADNTFPNLVPMLTGHFIEHYWNESVKNTMYFDDLDFIWKIYASKGYRTFYAEDSPYYGTFQFLKRGFKDPPTDYYYRTLGIAIEDSELKKRSRAYCLNDQLEIEILYGYLKDFVTTMADRPHFAFTMVSTLTHDYLNGAGYCDEPTYNLLKGLWEDGVMNRSMVVVFSDHGIRFGSIREKYIGKFEERMPFMYLSLPQWFLEKNRNIWRNLKANQDRLITLFDVHATLYHLLDVTKPIPEELKSSVTPNGLSLFGVISGLRTCERAKILPHWCACQVHKQVPTSDATTIEAASAIVNAINEQLKNFSDVCARLHVDLITDARLRQANDEVLRFVRHENDVLNRRVVYGKKVDALADYLITVRTRPGRALFESTVRHDVWGRKFIVMGISRINVYGRQSRCINSQLLKKFCFCKLSPKETFKYILQ